MIPAGNRNCGIILVSFGSVTCSFCIVLEGFNFCLCIKSMKKLILKRIMAIKERKRKKMEASSSASRALQLEYRSLQEEPVEGFRVKMNEENMFEWDVAIFGPPDTLYQGGYFKVVVKFPADYPYSPPHVRFVTKLWHPNVYENGDLCISILHPPVDDPQSGELPCERWNPTQNVRTVLLSVISLLNEPNCSSPANVDASVMYRKWKESKDKEYENIIKKQVEQSIAEAVKDGVKVPTTREEYCIKTKKPETVPECADLDFFDDDYDDDVDEYDDDIDDNDDSGNEV